MKKIKFFLIKYRNIILWLFGDPNDNEELEDIIKRDFPDFYRKHRKTSK